MTTKHLKQTKHKLAKKIKDACMAVIIFILLCLPFSCAFAYTESLSKTNSGQPSRYPLAFFVQKHWCDPQLIQSISTKPSILSEDKTIWHTCQQSMVWVTPLNNPIGEYAGRLLFVPRVSPSHLMNFHSVALTQKQIGGQS